MQVCRAPRVGAIVSAMAVPLAREILHQAFANAGLALVLFAIGGVAISTAWILWGGFTGVFGWARLRGLARAFRAAPRVEHVAVEPESRTLSVVIRRTLLTAAFVVLGALAAPRLVGIYAFCLGLGALVGCATGLILVRNEKRTGAMLVKRAERRGLLVDRQITFVMAKRVSGIA